MTITHDALGIGPHGTWPPAPSRYMTWGPPYPASSPPDMGHGDPQALQHVFTHDDVSSSSENYRVKDISTNDNLCNINRESAMQLKLYLRRTIIYPPPS